MPSERPEHQRRRCGHRDCTRLAVEVFEFVVPPASTTRAGACRFHAPDDLPPVEVLRE